MFFFIVPDIPGTSLPLLLPEMSAVSERSHITFRTYLGNLWRGSGTNEIQHKRLSPVSGELERQSRLL